MSGTTEDGSTNHSWGYVGVMTNSMWKLLESSTLPSPNLGSWRHRGDDEDWVKCQCKETITDSFVPPRTTLNLENLC